MFPLSKVDTGSYLFDMSDALAEAISTDDWPSPTPSQAWNPPLGDPRSEGNEHLLDDEDDPGAGFKDFSADDIHAPLANSDFQN